MGRVQDLVLAEGFARLTVDDLAARLQCSKSTLYAVSSSKGYLVTKALRHFFRDATSRIEAQVAEMADPAQASPFTWLVSAPRCAACHQAVTRIWSLRTRPATSTRSTQRPQPGGCVSLSARA